MLSREEAIGETEAALYALKLTGPLTPGEMHQFCQMLTARLQFKSKSGRLEDIRRWAENWQDFWLRPLDTASPHSLVARESVKFPVTVIYRSARNALVGIVDQAVAELHRLPKTLHRPIHSSPATYKSSATLQLLLGSLSAAWKQAQSTVQANKQGSDASFAKTVEDYFSKPPNCSARRSKAAGSRAGR
jgi:hypothetical protein